MHYIKTIFWLLLAFLFLPVQIQAEETDPGRQTGVIQFSLQYDKEQMEEYVAAGEEKGTGVYVYLQNIDKDTIYRLPLTQVNHYSERFEMPYGNYRVIPSPETSNGDYVITCPDVFALSARNHTVDIACEMKKMEWKSDKTVTGKETAKPAEPTNVGEADAPAEKGFRLSLQNILTIPAFIIVIGIFLYSRRGKGRK